MNLRSSAGQAYVEWLRVVRCLKWTGIVLGVLFLIAAMVRVAVIGKHDYAGWALSLKADPGSKTTESDLPGAVHRTVVDDPAKGLRVVIDERPGGLRHIEVYDKTGKTSRDAEDGAITMGSVSVHDLPNGQGTLTVVDSTGETDFLAYIVSGVCIAMIVATCLGAPFAREADGHLEIALTKPIGRERLALATIATDATGILIALVCGIAFALLVHLLFEVPAIAFGARDAIALGVAIAAPLAWYAMLAAATASLPRGWGAVIGLAWPVAAVVLGLGHLEPNGNALVALVRDAAAALSFLVPLQYMHFGTASAQSAIGGEFAESGIFKIAMPALLAVAYSALAVLQWRRLEA
ncbi:MAG: hypothetical protein JO029_09815 [Candidatus Eremiobacteraeota bacterium]|nr:hypothetical protein [Candidatus Eremiobacteraeota bacterium]MBV8434561.1 hypothetical protein [Candidatus Eremiobacteraeota bacterium]